MFSRSGKFFSLPLALSFSSSRKSAGQKALSRRRAFRRMWLLQRLEDRVVFSGTPWADILSTMPQAAHNYCTQADVSLQKADAPQAAGANANPFLPLSPAVDHFFGAQLFDASIANALAKSTDAATGGGSARVTLDGSSDAAAAVTANANTVPAPFWRKVGNQPTLAPDWYANQSAVTREVYYDTNLTASQNGALLQQVLSSLAAGDHLRIHGGTYSIDSFFMMKVAGTAQNPITIEGAPGEQVVITRANTAQNTLNIDQSQYLIVEGLTIKGGDTGLKLYNVNNFMLHDVEIYGTANNAVAANSSNTSYLYFIDNNIHNTGAHGEGFYIGAMDGSVVSHHTYVIGNYIHDLKGGTVTQGDGIEIKDGSYAVTIKYNFIANTNYPGIIVYRTGRGMTDRNVIEENVVLNSNDNAIQAAADAIIRNNLVVTGKTAFQSKPYLTDPQNLTVVNNTFVAVGAGVKTTNWGASNTFANNAVYSSTQQYIPSGTGSAVTGGNVLVTNLATAFTNLKLDGTALDATPIAGSPLIGTASPTYLPALDLNGHARTTASDSGAVDYVGEKVATVISSFDFGTDTSPVASGQTRVTPASKYSSASGYGWLASYPSARDRGAPDDARRDFNFITSGSMTFATDVPSGTYQVTMVIGDQSYATGATGVLLEGSQVDTVSTSVGQFVTKTYVVNVSDGQLTLTLNKLGLGATVINSLTIESAADSPGVVVKPTSGLITDESGTSAAFTVALSSQPAANVIIALSSSDTTEGSVSPGSLTFTAANWNQPQTVTVTGVDDAVADGDVNYTIVLAAAQSTDPAYNGLNPADVSVTNTDDDVVVTPLSGFDFGTDASPVASGQKQVTSANTYDAAAGYGWLTPVSEVDRGAPDDMRRDFNYVASGSMTFGADVPAGDYQVTIVVGDQASATNGMTVQLEGRQVDTLSTAAGQFLTKTYLVTVADGQLTLTLTAGTSGLALINALDIEDAVPGTTAGIVVSPTSGLTTTEAGGTAAFSVSLSSQPTADVVIDVASSDTSEGTVAPSQLTFTSANWNQPQTVTIQGVDDAVVDGNVAYSVVLAAAQSADPAYNGLDAADVAVTNADNDVAATVGSFDFGTDTSPVASGQTRVTPASKYSSANGYGWLASYPSARDRGAPDDARRDFNFITSGSMTFATDVPSGTYQVTMVIGDQSYATGATGVLLEGSQVDTVSTSVGQFVTKTYVVNVSDGQLTLTLNKLGLGATVINSLTIDRVV